MFCEFNTFYYFSKNYEILRNLILKTNVKLLLLLIIACYKQINKYISISNVFNRNKSLVSKYINKFSSKT